MDAAQRAAEQAHIQYHSGEDATENSTAGDEDFLTQNVKSAEMNLALAVRAKNINIVTDVSSREASLSVKPYSYKR